VNLLAGQRIDGHALVESGVFHGHGVQRQRGAALAGRTAVSAGRTAVSAGRTAVPTGRTVVSAGCTVVSAGRTAVPTGRTAVPPGPELGGRSASSRRRGGVVKPVHVGRRRAVPGHTVQSHRAVDERCP